jgi:hypothetical protein
MFRGANRLLIVAVVVAGAVLVAPAAALACNNGGPSAANVYRECALPNGGGGGNPTGPAISGEGDPSPVSNRTLQALAQTGKDKPVLSAMLKGYGVHRHLQAADASEASGAPSALGSAFDLGSGPTALLIVLAGTAALLLGGSGFRVWRSRHRL